MTIWTVEACDANSPARLPLEATLDAGRVPIPLYARSAWQAASGARAATLFVARDVTGEPRACLGADTLTIRSLPLHAVIRVPRFGWSVDLAAGTAVLESLAGWAFQQFRVLRCRVRIVTPHLEEHRVYADCLSTLGFRRAAQPESYEYSVLVDLCRPLDAIHASFTRSTRQNIREIERRPLEVSRLVDSSLIPRLNQLMFEAFGRTGGSPPLVPWSTLMRLAESHDARLRMVGVFHRERSGPEALLGFAVAAHHGLNVEYVHGASTRDHRLGRVSLNHALQWDLIRWAHETGASWYDLGGAAKPGTPNADRLRGITEFKLGFGSELACVGTEYELCTRPWRNRIAHVVSRVGRFMRTTG